MTANLADDLRARQRPASDAARELADVAYASHAAIRSDDTRWHVLAVLAGIYALYMLTLGWLRPEMAPAIPADERAEISKTELLVRVKSMLRVKTLHDQLSQKVSELEDAKKLVDTGRNLNVNKILEETVDPTGSVPASTAARQSGIAVRFCT